jgi:hypothetical protein
MTDGGAIREWLRVPVKSFPPSLCEMVGTKSARYTVKSLPACQDHWGWEEF